MIFCIIGLTVGRIAKGKEKLLTQIGRQFGTEITVDERGETLLRGGTKPKATNWGEGKREHLEINGLKVGRKVAEEHS